MQFIIRNNINAKYHTFLIMFVLLSCQTQNQFYSHYTTTLEKMLTLLLNHFPLTCPIMTSVPLASLMLSAFS